MKNVKYLFVLFLYVIICKDIYSQNLYGLKSYTLYVGYSDDIKWNKFYFPSENDIIRIIGYEIPELNNTNKFVLDFTQCNIVINYNYFKNYDETSAKQYYGSIDINVYRYLKAKDIPKDIYASVCNNSSFFVIDNPTNEMLKKESAQIINQLITYFKAQYYQDNK
jgi:hypothetical protein